MQDYGGKVDITIKALANQNTVIYLRALIFSLRTKQKPQLRGTSLDPGSSLPNIRIITTVHSDHEVT